MNEKTEINNVY